MGQERGRYGGFHMLLMKILLPRLTDTQKKSTHESAQCQGVTGKLCEMVRFTFLSLAPLLMPTAHLN